MILRRCWKILRRCWKIVKSWKFEAVTVPVLPWWCQEGPSDDDLDNKGDLDDKIEVDGKGDLDDKDDNENLAD